MALYHVRLKVFSRTRGESATAAAAYRAGIRIDDDRTGEVHDYTKRRGVERVDFFAPADSPVWTSNPSALFNACEAAEVRGRNGRVAREAVVALPAELTADGRAALVGDVCRWLVERYGVATMAATHAPDTQGDQRNHHCHILMTTRRVGSEGLGTKARQLDDRATGPLEIRALRAAVADITNRHLARAGAHDRVDHRTLKAQADDAMGRGDYANAILLTRRPTVHLGRSVTALQRRGADTLSDGNRGVRADNRSMLLDYLRRAEQEGRLMEAPRGSREQARLDAALSLRGAAPRLPVVAGRVVPSLRISKGGTSPPPRSSRAQGPGARVLAAQARLGRQNRRDEARAHARFVALLDQLRLDLAARDRETLWAYGRASRCALSDLQALAAHGRRDPGCFDLLRRSLRARHGVEEAERRIEDQRRQAGDAMVRTAQVRAALDRFESEAQPSRLRVLSRREWAEKRRHQRAAIAQAERDERQAVGGPEVVAARAALTTARVALEQVEEQRRRVYGVPGDPVPAAVVSDRRQASHPVPTPDVRTRARPRL